MTAGKTAEACDKYFDAQMLDPRGATALDLALCREKQGRIGSAYIWFDIAEKMAKDEKRTDRASTAASRKSALYMKLARITVTVPKEVVVPGMEVRVGLANDPRALNLLPESDWGKSVAVDTGEIKVMVTAPGKATWEKTLDVKALAKPTITVPPLADGSGPPAPFIPPGPGPQVGPGPGPGPGPQIGPGPYPTPGPAPRPNPTSHEKGRVVIDIGFLAGAHLSLINQAPLSEINGTQYLYKADNQSEIFAACGNTTAVPGAGDCDATFNPQFGFVGGAQLFLGYGITDEIQLGGRFFGGAHYPIGFAVMGGPSMSFKAVGPLWVGFSLLVGTTQIEATVTGAKGSVPDSNVVDNEDQNQVDIPVEDLAGGGETPFALGGAVAPSFAGFEVGGSVELSIVLVDNPTNDAASGALLLSAWPTGMWAPDHGGVLMLPVGLGYRFY